MRWLVAMLVMAIAVPVFAYHEFKVPKKAYKKVTIEHFSNDAQKTEPDSTITIFYDKDGVEIHREFKKGCSNILNRGWQIQDDSLMFNLDSTSFDSAHWGTLEATIINITPAQIDDYPIIDSSPAKIGDHTIFEEY